MSVDDVANTRSNTTVLNLFYPDLFFLTLFSNFCLVIYILGFFVQKDNVQNASL